jgi:hypothetical protein
MLVLSISPLPHGLLRNSVQNTTCWLGLISGWPEPAVTDWESISLPSVHLYASKCTSCIPACLVSFGITVLLSKALTAACLVMYRYFNYHGPVCIPDCMWRNGVHFCLQYCGVLSKAEAELSPCAICIHSSSSTLRLFWTRLFTRQSLHFRWVQPIFPFTSVRKCNLERFVVYICLYCILVSPSVLDKKYISATLYQYLPWFMAIILHHTLTWAHSNF